MPVFSDASELLFQGKWNAILGILETSNLVSHSFHIVYVVCLSLSFVAFSPNPVSSER